MTKKTKKTNSTDVEFRTIQTETYYRSAVVGRDNSDKENRQIEIAFSSEEPYERYFGVEVLDHDASSIDMSFIKGGTAPLLVEHSRSDLVGVLEKAWIGSDRVGRVISRLGRGEQAEKELQDVQDGIRLNASVGYRVNRMVLEEEVKDGPDIYRVVDWTPLEVSLVAIPADPTVGVGRSDNPRSHQTLVEIKSESPQPAERNNPVTEEEKLELERLRNADATRKSEEAAKLRTAEIKVKADELAEKRVKEVNEIYELAARHNMRTDADEAIKKGISLEAFRGLVLDKFGDATAIETPVSELGMEKKEAKRFSIYRAIEAILAKNWDKAGFELECTKAVADKLDRSAQGFFVPHDVLMVGDFTRGAAQQRAMQQRNLLTSGSGGNLVGTDHAAGSFIDLLRNRMAIMGLGARSLEGLVGNVDIPRQTGGAVAYWLGEGGSVTPSDQTYDKVTLTPTTVAAKTNMSRRMLLQSDPTIEGLTRDDLITTLALATDLGAINGSGAANQLEGILNVTGIGDVAGGANGLAPDWDHIVDLETDVAIANADMGALNYLTNAKVRGKLKKTFVDGPGSGERVFHKGELNDYPAHVSNQVPSDLVKGASGAICSAIIFGNWADLLVGHWGVIDLKPDEITLADEGALVLRVFQDIDTAVRHPESFSAMQDALTA